MTTPAENAATKVCSAIQYLVDRGEIEEITDVLTHVRYTNKEVVEFDVACDGRVVRFLATEVGDYDTPDDGDDEDELAPEDGIVIPVKLASEIAAQLDEHERSPREI